MSEEYVVKDGKVANVYVYVKDGLGNKFYVAPTTPAVLDQKGCRYVPHVIGAMVGQPVEFRNSRPHDAQHAMQPTIAGNRRSTSPSHQRRHPRHVFAKPELMIPVRCNNHPWMEAFLNIASNPFFAVTGEEGHFAIHGLPPGTYTLVADAGKAGPQPASVM